MTKLQKIEEIFIQELKILERLREQWELRAKEEERKYGKANEKTIAILVSYHARTYELEKLRYEIFNY